MTTTDTSGQPHSTGVAAWPVAAVAASIALLHILTNGRYGFHRDELQFLSDSRHLAWGYVSYPPFTPAIERLSTTVFGLWMPGLRLASVLAQAAVVLLAGGMARAAGGGRTAQLMAALATGFAPLEIFEGTEFQYTSFETLWIVLLSYAALRLLQTEDPRWWLLAGLAAGLGVETKYTLVFVIAGLLAGYLFTSQRRLLRNRWFAAGLAITLLQALPNLLWQTRHSFISYRFLQSIHARDVDAGRGSGFWVNQLVACVLTATVPLLLAGLWRAAREPRWRPLLWMWAVPVLFFAVTRARFYYTAGVYPMMLALGAPSLVTWLQGRGERMRYALLVCGAGAFAVNAAVVLAMLVPLASRGPLRAFALRHSEDLRAEIGWDEIAARVAAVRDALPPDQRADYGVVVGNYGAQGAIEILGARFGLPVPISRTNSAWLRGYPEPPPDTLIVLGFSSKAVAALFTGCRVAASAVNSEGVDNEESRWRPDIYVCAGPSLPWPAWWQKYQAFG